MTGLYYLLRTRAAYALGDISVASGLEYTTYHNLLHPGAGGFLYGQKN